MTAGSGYPGQEAPQGLLVVLPSLMAGGAERSLVSLALQFSRRLPVALAAVRATGDLSHEIGGSIPAIPVFDLGGRFAATWQLVRLVRKQRPAVVLSTMWDVNLLVLLSKSCFPRATKVAVREAVTPASLGQESRWPRFWHALYRLFYRRADAIIVMTEEMKQVLISDFGLPAALITVIPNAVQPDRCGDGANAGATTASPKQFVSMGRLVRQKGFDVLIRSFARVVHSYPEACLRIYGEGPELVRLQILVDALALGDRVLFAGVARHPREAFESADIYVLSSRYEGMSNAMLEALCAGIPVVAVRRHTGAAEVVREGFNGFLVPECTEDELTKGILRAMMGYQCLNRRAIKEDAQQRFSSAGLMEKYFRLFSHLSRQLLD